MELRDWLGLSVLGAIIGVVGSIVTLYLKDVIAARSFERWKNDRELDAIYSRYRRPLGVAARELSGRCFENSVRSNDWRSTFGVYQLGKGRESKIREAFSQVDYYRYKLLSDAYRLCCLLGWIELYRRDVGLLDIERTAHGRQLEKCVQNIRSELGDGQRNYHYGDGWYDYLIFREEQRTIGYRMIAREDASVLIDFGTFCDSVAREMLSDVEGHWFLKAVEFFSYLKHKKDFRIVRMKYLILHLAELSELLQPGLVPAMHLQSNHDMKTELDAQRKAALAELSVI